MRIPALLALLLVGGCLGDPAPTGAPDRMPTPDIASATLDAPTFFAPVDLGWAGRTAEPSVTVAPDGWVYVAAAPQLWRSPDGRAFEPVGKAACALSLPSGCAPGYTVHLTSLDGFAGGDMAFGADASGTLYYVGLMGQRATLPFHVSRDRGDTWSEPFDLAGGNVTDRQWMKVLANGTLLVTWRDFGLNSEGPDLMMFRRSLDGGATWEPTRVIGADPLIQGTIGADERSGAIFIPYYEGGLRVARSLDGGLTWDARVVTEEARDTTLRDGRPIDMFPTAAVDDAGAVHLAWAADDASALLGSKDASFPRAWIASSTDGGATWSEPRPLSPEGKVAAFAWIVAGAPGRVAVTWLEGRLGTASQTAPDVWDVIVVESLDATSPDAEFLGGAANDEPVHLGGLCRSGGGCQQVCTPLAVPCLAQGRDHGEVYEMALRDGHPILAWVADAPPTTPGIEVHVGGVERGTRLR